MIPWTFFRLLILSLFIVPGIANAQQQVFDKQGVGREAVLDHNIKSIQLYREGWISSYPVLTVREEIPLILEFDELSEDLSYFRYTIYHCDADWRRSEMTEQEYLDGYSENPINDFEGSFNTYMSYYHYRVSLPNEDIRFRISGNYLLVVFRENDPSQVVFSRRFLVSEASVTVNARAHRPILSEYRNDCQEVDVTVQYAGYNIDDPYGETTLSIYQNGIWDNGITGLKPQFTNPNELVYDYQKENIFKAGNEYRMFITRNTQVREYHIADIDYSEYFHFTLKPDEPNRAHLYFDREDLNGRFYIEAANARQPELEADYVFVHFTLKMPFPYATGEVYIAGAATDWQFSGQNRMTYDYDRSAYTATLLLKQGVYNYRYIYLPGEQEIFDISEIEGSHYETGNEYLVLFYHRQRADRYDRLVGHQVVHSNRN